MAYIGSTPTSQNFISGTDYFNGTGSQTAFTLTRSVNSVNDVQVTVNNVVQLPSSYTVSGTTLTLSAAPSSGTSNVYVRYLATNQQSFTVGNNTVGYNQLTADLQADFGMKNRIINGAMVIDQRNAGASVTNTTSNLYSLDRWTFYGSQASKFTVQQNAGSVTPPVGFTYYSGITSSSAYTVGSSESFIYRQKIEGYNIADLNWGSASAKTVTLSFQVYSSLTGTFGGSILNSAENYSYPFSYTVSSANTWTTVSVTIAGPTAGSWLTTNGIGLTVLFSLGCGSVLSGTANTWSANAYYQPTGSVSVVGTSGATFYITGVQLEVGTTATNFDFRSYGTELALCQRYFQTYLSPPLRGVIVTGGAAGRMGMILPVVMRANPTAVVGTLGIYDGGNTSNTSAVTAGYNYTTAVEYDFTLVSTLTQYRPAIVYQTGAGSLTLSAEL